MYTTIENARSHPHDSPRTAQPTRRLRVAFVSYDFGEYSVRHANALSERNAVLLVLGHDVCSAHAHLLSKDVQLYQFDKPRLRQPFRQFFLIRQILSRIHRFQPDVVHFQGGHLWFNLALPQLRRYPLVLTVHNPRHHVGDHDSRRTPQRIMDFGYHRADQIIVHGKLLKRQVQEELGIASDKIHVISHIVMGERSRDLHVPEQRNLLLFFGRIWEYKGLEYLIRAEPLISQHIPDVRILIAGKGDDMERYRRMMVHPERFEIVNEFVSNEQREIFFEQASVIVLPYINATQSGVVPIAYTHAKPVVATRVGSLQEFVDDGETGFLVYPRDEHALAAAVVKLLANDSLRREMGQRGRAKLDAECAPQVVADKHREVYEVAIAGKANRCKS